ncbi:hypothetical protein G4177_00440 [Corallococcus sp. ZKHCc1 1396]|uniref:Immunity MXAN-0049 protein domain-containing protein n=1 Tax=Corallococcus soli TaxID=2710757 RepID=A0ABR9PFE2_9BACT|nr:DUF1629 domain-containing protein [Corallococcus soli]MBE4746637.1 hypothetical protein [Corallococcus soli]
MPNFKFHIVTSPDDPRFCSIKRKPETILKAWRLREGVLFGADFPSTARFEMDKRAGEMAPDLLPNVLSLLMISPRVRSLFEAERVSDVEYLPFELASKRGSVVSRDYAVANLIGSVDCLDAARSKFDEDPLEPGGIANLYKLNLHLDRIPEDKKLFRLKQMMHEFIIRSDLLQLLREQGVTGLTTLDLDADIIL